MEIAGEHLERDGRVDTEDVAKMGKLATEQTEPADVTVSFDKNLPCSPYVTLFVSGIVHSL